ncbi:hypothetical protein [Phaeocystidibacter marisrubri]|uniref:Tetratricopeptide repeat protein n=1 Tax=Phaeocystidibacter marisrubri TaxID=1577780 RepID=A0A6L3ZGB2_9FLAO|nr:hypothetical protein [Phaeocystidibacter marisrubri]KAB2817072.1 hypothetical protein F8C82_01360 [Phaeocystidibacter marisrubri]GGH76971.1 hypothetical protein GCM10011318_26040 [Phaeocystidibacter marisrubri]
MKLPVITLLLSTLSFFAYAQDNLEIVKVQQTQSFYLNNSTRAAIGTGDNRTYLALSLPENTIEWYYAFRAVKESSSESLNLFSQLIEALEPSGISSSLFNSMTVPEGNVRCNIYVTDESNAIQFSKHLASSHWTTGTRENYSQGIVRINDPIQPTLYLCFENPNVWEGLTLYVEVTALVKKNNESEEGNIQPEETANEVDAIAEGVSGLIDAFQSYRTERRENAEARETAQNYSNASWVFYEAGDFSTSIEYVQKALELVDHPELHFNQGLSQWCAGLRKESTESYLAGINLINDLDSKEDALEVLQNAIDNIAKGRQEYHFFSEDPPALKLLQLKFNSVFELRRWSDRH